MSETLDLASLTVDDFSTHVHAKFDLSLPDGLFIPIILIKTQELGVKGSGRKRAFSLLFEGPRDPILPQKIYSLHEDTLGSLDIFLVPVGVTQEHCQYEAVFN